MWQMASQLSAFSVFLGIAAVGFLFLLGSLVVGELDHGDLDHGGMDHGPEGPAFLSPRVISVFVTAFGGFGAVATYMGYGVLPSSMFGLAGGFAFGGMVYMFARFLYGQQASSTIVMSELVGRTAEVTVGIPASGSGQVRCLVGETVIEKVARSRDGAPIPHNALVRIDEIVGESVIVSSAADARTAAAPRA
jgi:hypothetical protein